VLVDSLKEKAKEDAEIQKILQPELDRQHKAVVARRSIYGNGGSALLISTGILILWFTWLRPRQGGGAGVPMRFLKFLERPAEVKRRVPKKASDDSQIVV
jgi:hypothetical protein